MNKEKLLRNLIPDSIIRHPLAVAVGGEDGLQHPGSGQVIGEDFIHQVVNILKDVSSANPFLIVGGGGCNGKVVSLISVRRNR